jgi:hypothetical protein
MSSQTPEEKVACQTETAKAVMGRCMSNLKDMTDMMARNQCQAMEAIGNRVCESMDEIQCMMKNGRAA